jgi:hypothetical protein
MAYANRVVLHGVVVRFFHGRADAINEASLRTKATSSQHRALETPHGFLVKCANPVAIFDAAGEVPPAALEGLAVRNWGG